MEEGHQFNIGIATVEDIHNTLYRLKEGRLSGDPYMIKKLLRQLYIQSYIYLDDKDKEFGLTMLNDIKHKVYVKGDNIHFSRGISDQFDEFEIWIRDKLKSILAPKGDDLGLVMR